MRLQKIAAEPHPYGNRIELKWENPEPDQYPGVKVVRREGTFPTSPEDGLPVVERNAFLFSTDLGPLTDLDNRIISYELRQLFFNRQILLSNNAFVTIKIEGSRYVIHDKEQQFVLRKTNSEIHAYSKGIDTITDQNLKNETVYYYALFPYTGDPPEYVFDRYNRAAAMATGQYNIAGQMYDLLPRIYHRYDTVLSDQVADQDKEKGALRRFLDIPGSLLDQFHSFAKAILNAYNLDKVDGRLLPLLAQWIGWKTDHSLEFESQRNEIRDAPALYKTIGIIPTVETTVKRMSGWESCTKELVHNVFLSNRPERLNIWSRERSSAGGWSQPTKPLSLDFAYEGRPAGVKDNNKIRLFYHTYKKRQWKRDKTHREVCNIWYKTSDSANGWTPSEPLTNRLSIDKYPTTAVHGDMLWVFWSVYDEQDNKWHIEYRTNLDEEWSPIETFADSENEHKRPLAIADDTGGLWLFWLEKVGTRWQMKYNRHDGTNWELDPPADFPMDGESMEDPFVLFNAADSAKPIFVFWARKEPTPEPDRMKWTIAYRFKQSLNPTTADWVATVHILPKDPTDATYHDREPAPFVTNGNIELFWSSNRDGSWSIWRNALLDADNNTWEGDEQLTQGPYSQRDPVPLSRDDSIMLIYRSNQGIRYTSDVYRATETTDFRYSGCTTLDTRNINKISLRGKYGDFQTYTYDVKKENEDWYARDTIGLYLKNDTMDKEKIDAGVERIKNVLNEFMPITDRAVFITQQDMYIENVYLYGLPFNAEPRIIDESYKNNLINVSNEVVPGPREDIS